MRLRHLIALSATLATSALALPAHAADPQGFIEHEHQRLEQMLHQPPSPARDAEVNAALDSFVDYDNLVQRAFGEPCHPSIPTCEDLWARWDDAQKKQLHDLLKQVIENSYRRNLTKTLDYDVSYKGSRDVAGDTRVLTEAKSKVNPRDTPVRVDYVVKQEGNGFRVIDIITEGSSFSKNLYVQFRKLDDYDKIVGKLKDKIAKKD
jgi:phospholipid transport system substrate-binding protein